jgi:hypothetical protein
MFTPARLKLRDDFDHVQDVAVCVSPNPIWPSDAKAFKIGATDERRVTCRFVAYFLIRMMNPFSSFFFASHPSDHRQLAASSVSISCHLGTMDCSSEISIFGLLCAGVSSVRLGASSSSQKVAKEVVVTRTI